MINDTPQKDLIAALVSDIASRDRTIAALERKIVELTDALECRDVDELTGLHNLRWLREWWAGMRRPADVVGAVAFIDVDGLKRVNDTYGHKIGDRVITHVAAVLISSGCFSVRYGGDEFLLFVPAGWDVRSTLDRIIDDIAACRIPTRDGVITVSASCGARIITDEDLWQMIHDADREMYGVKRAGSALVGCRIAR